LTGGMTKRDREKSLAHDKKVRFFLMNRPGSLRLKSTGNWFIELFSLMEGGERKFGLGAFE